RIRQRALRLSSETSHERGHEPKLSAHGTLPLTGAPGIEVREVPELQSFEEVSAETLCRGLELLHGGVREPVVHQVPQLGDVDPDVARVEPDAAPIGDHPLASVVID